MEINKNEICTKIICDEYKISQVIRNLLSNGIKFTPENGKIVISIEKPQDQVTTLQVNITDQGVGIPKDELGSVFDKFVQSSITKTGAGGTGLGLAICKEIITAHNGKIWAENNPKGGSTFSFMLPHEQDVK